MKAAIDILKKGLEADPPLPRLLRHVMRALSDGNEAAAAWRELGTDEKTVNTVVARVTTALESALHEHERKTATIEKEGRERIAKLARDLQLAIKDFTPGDWCRPFAHELRADDFPPVSLGIGWHSLRPGGHGFGHQLAVTDVLDWVISEVSRELPVRAVTRKRDDPKVASFVRHLAWQFKRAFGKEMHGTIGHIATAVFKLKNPLDKYAVQGILKDRPDEFKAPT